MASAVELSPCTIMVSGNGLLAGVDWLGARILGGSSTHGAGIFATLPSASHITTPGLRACLSARAIAAISLLGVDYAAWPSIFGRNASGKKEYDPSSTSLTPYVLFVVA